MEVKVTNAGSSQSIQSGTALGRYAVVDLVGMGGVAEVYEAVHLGLRKRVALKVLRREVRDHGEVRARFLREGRNASLVNHPNVVDIYDVGELNGLPYLVMEHLEGESLAELLERDGQLDEQQAVQLILPIIAGVLAGHRAGVVHRDLKPENIFLARDGHRRTTPKILDFGVSKALAATDAITMPDTAIGTPHYMSPEQARGERVQPQMDQYAIGVMLYELLTGRLPRHALEGEALLESVAFGDFEPPSAWRPGLDSALEAVILKAMASAPAHRYPNLEELALALLPFTSTRAQEHWRPEFAGTDSVKLRVQRAADIALSDAPAITHRETDELISEEVLGGPLSDAAPTKPHAPLWDDDETGVTEISQLLPQLPPDVQAVMTRWRRARDERLMHDRHSTLPSAVAPLPTSMTAPRSRWLALTAASLMLALALGLILWVVFKT
ncbi:MAG: serine/threonine protein kinase [Polyangiaceae bacterium]|nr:serine/threonine protein kinase [Polyangiaceae bacterium]MCW5790139.1 serine/threonine protein kinase [Polyangiaceae bacterium]